MLTPLHQQRTRCRPVGSEEPRDFLAKVFHFALTLLTGPHALTLSRSLSLSLSKRREGKALVNWNPFRVIHIRHCFEVSQQNKYSFDLTVRLLLYQRRPASSTVQKRKK